MKRFTTNKVILAWLLSVTFVLPHVVKSVHIFQNVYRENVSHSHECSHPESKHQGYPEHNCTHCLVCQFTLAFFTETKPFNQLIVERHLNAIIYSVYQEDIYIPFFTSHHLRAPPFC
ncbi:MAG: hypothetical protein LBV74_22425 [Tannerella sp.]|jgi:hypothetical protein|nr:hypothetical protein [Tannerella sp.]